MNVRQERLRHFLQLTHGPVNRVFESKNEIVIVGDATWEKRPILFDQTFHLSGHPESIDFVKEEGTRVAISTSGNKTLTMNSGCKILRKESISEIIIQQAELSYVGKVIDIQSELI
jgi:hypothetical protein